MLKLFSIQNIKPQHGTQSKSNAAVHNAWFMNNNFKVVWLTNNCRKNWLMAWTIWRLKLIASFHMKLWKCSFELFFYRNYILNICSYVYNIYGTIYKLHITFFIFTIFIIIDNFGSVVQVHIYYSVVYVWLIIYEFIFELQNWNTLNFASMRCKYTVKQTTTPLAMLFRWVAIVT